MQVRRVLYDCNFTDYSLASNCKNVKYSFGHECDGLERITEMTYEGRRSMRSRMEARV
jgi:hypothetical protein